MSNDLKDLKKQERQLRATVECVKRFVDKYNPEKHKLQVDARLDMLETTMKKFYTVRRKIDLLLEEADEKATAEVKEKPEERTARLEQLAEQREAESAELMGTVEDTFCELKASLLAMLTPSNGQSTTSGQAIPPATSASARVKLPEIRLPGFGGHTRDWVTFRDMFQSLIHRNDQLAEMDKFSYLRSSLTGEALQEIGSIEMTAANYTIAWDLLQKRYENKKLIVKAHIDALFSVESMKRESYDTLNHLISEYDRNLQQLEKMGENTDGWSTLLVHMVCSRLDSATLRSWESHHSSKEVPNYEELMDFLRNQCSILQSIAPAKPSQPIEPRKSKFSVSHPSVQASNRCPFCGEGQHSAFKCQKFLKMTTSERYDRVKRLGLCLNCLSPSHLVRSCTYGTCRHCQQKHHTLLHHGSTNGGASSSSSNTGSSVPHVQNRPKKANTQQTQPQNQNQTTPIQNTGSSTSSYPIANNSHTQSPPTTDPTLPMHTNTLPASIHTPSRQVLLSTAVVCIIDCYGNSRIARALLDSCSEYCFITTNLYQKLKLREVASHLSVAGIGGSVVQSTKMVEALIRPRESGISSFSESMHLHVLPKLTANLPVQQIALKQLLIPSDVVLADPEFYIPSCIDLIIGAEHYYDLLDEGRIKTSDNGPTLQKTVFGWVVSGRVPGPAREVPRTAAHVCATVDLRDLLTKFWQLESCNSKSTLSVEEAACEEIFDRTTVRDEEGRFVVTMPKKEYIIKQLGDSRTIALKQFHSLERRFATNDTLKKLYVEFIEEYLSMGHMREVAQDEEFNQPSYYLPHHAVLKPESTTTKLRTVFNASCKTSTGFSLNDGLMVGPVVQQDLLSIILRFRFLIVAIIADIAKMYRMVKMTLSDQALLRIFWRSNLNEPVKSYQLTTVTYGTASAPYLATKCLQRLSEEGELTHPVAAKIVRKDFYVDDLLTGTDDVEEAKELVKEMIELTTGAGFTLRKWSSNNAEVLACIPEDLRDERTTLELDSSTSTVKTLGLIWEPATDNFRYAVPKWSPEATITKRVVLSDTARIFDPLGLIGPVVVLAKMFLHLLWKEMCDWDDPLPVELQNSWLEFRRNLVALDSLSVPRWTGFTKSLISVEIHGFCDASEKAYGACLYLRAEHSDGSVTVRLITAKSRVAPLEDLARKRKKQSIPRLELSSALLLSHLYEKLCSSIDVSIPAFFWTDSMIVKCWLASLPSRWQNFVANRVSEIQHLTKNCPWNHVAGEQNPADIISRGMIPAQLQYQSTWFEGPLWLREDRSTWPKVTSSQSELDPTVLEERATVSLITQEIPPNEIFQQFSSFPKLVRVIAMVHRFAHNAKPQNQNCRKSGLPSHAERENALLSLVRLAQQDSFPEDLSELAKSKQVKSTSRICRLNPILVDGVLRVGGRLANAPVPENRKHPIILHHQHPLTKLIMTDYHQKHFHSGQQLLISSVRGRFWPTNARSLARKVIHECVQCFRNKPKVHEQLMADLPSVRVTPASAFLNVGVDFCGPFLVRYPVRKSVPVKCFVAIFVCLATKAVHMELVADLTTQAFLAAFRRFAGIRGVPKVVMCDNATNFVGASRELRELRQQLMNQQAQSEIIRGAEEDGTEFKFIPARSPNFGGLWEAAVKSFKGHFRKTIGDRQLLYDEMNTVVHQISAILNSRPLTPLSNDPSDFEALTPGHFLIGRPLTAVPEPNLSNISKNRLSAWQQAQDYVQEIWKKWMTSYLSDLHSRTKWTQKRDNIRIGTMVLVKEDNLPPQKWRLGRIAEVFTGSDNNIRVVTVRTKDGLFKRGISKICILPIRDNLEMSPSNEN